MESGEGPFDMSPVAKTSEEQKGYVSVLLLDPYEFLSSLRSAKPADSRLLKRLNRGRKLPPHARISAISLYRIMNVREVVVG